MSEWPKTIPDPDTLLHSPIAVVPADLARELYEALKRTVGYVPAPDQVSIDSAEAVAAVRDSLLDTIARYEKEVGK